MGGSGKVLFKRLSPARRALGILWGVLVLLGLGYHSFQQMEHRRIPMEQAGWGRYLKVESPVEFYWRCLEDTSCSHILTANLLNNASVTVFAVVLVVGLAWIIKPERYHPRPTLSQRWANEKDIQPLVERRKPQEITDAALRGEVLLGGYLGVWTDPANPRRRLFLRPTKRLNDVHSITYAGTGGGKTVGSFRPRIALDAAEGNIAVVLDTKYPNPNDSYVDMRDYFRAFGRQVTVINPFELGDGIQIPVLTEIKGYSQALDIARLIYPPDLEVGEDPGAKVYISNARLLLAGILYGLSLGPRETQNFREVYQVANLGMERVRQWFHGRPQAADEIRSTLETDKKVFSGAINRLVEDLTIFRMDSAVETFSPGPREVDLARVLLTPGMIHLVLPESYIRGSSGRAILRFFKRYLDGRMLSLAERLTRPLPVHINYYYDEFALFGFLPNLNDDLATLRSRNISLHMALQNRSQAINIYGEHGWAATVDNNIGTTVILPGSFTQNDARYWSKTLGEVSIEQYSIGETQVPEALGKKVNRSLNVKEERTALINEDELQRMELGELIAVVRGFPPIRLRSYPVEFPASEGNPIAWIYEYVSAWKKAHLREALHNGWLEEAWRVLSSAPPAESGDDPLRDGLGPVHQGNDPLSGRRTAVHQGDDPLSGRSTSVHPGDDPLRDGLGPVHREDGLTPEVVQRRFGEWMERLAREQIGVQAEGRPGKVNRYILSRALELAPLEKATLQAFVELGYLRYRRGLYYIVPEKCPWGRNRLALWEASAYVQYRTAPEGAA